MTSRTRRMELGTFLRSRRAQLQPRDVGLPPGTARRRTPGLRREEVAQVSGVGLTWYTWLEQGRDIPASDQTVELLARGLRLSPDEHRYLRRLAGLEVTAGDDGSDELSGPVQRMVEGLLPNPAYVLTWRFDYVAWNDAYALVYRDPDELPPPHRNLLWLTFTDPQMRRLLPEWRTRAFGLLAQFRAASARHADEREFGELVDELRAASPEFAGWWEQYPVMDFRRDVHRVEHPVAGRITMELAQLRMVDHPTLSLVLQIPRTPADREALERLLDRGGGRRPGPGRSRILKER